MEAHRKRQKEMRRLERQREKVAKRTEIKARKAADITSGSDGDISTTEDPAAPAAGSIDDGLR